MLAALDIFRNLVVKAIQAVEVYEEEMILLVEKTVNNHLVKEGTYGSNIHLLAT